MEKFKHNKTGDVVHIVDRNGNFLILDNGLQITDDSFIRNYTPISGIDNDSLLEEINSGQKLINQNLINYRTNSSSVDPESFFNTSNISQIAQKIQHVDSKSVVDLPNSQRTTVKFIDAGSEPLPNNVIEQKKEQLIHEYNRSAEISGSPKIGINRLSDNDLSRFKQIDENSDHIPMLEQIPKTSEPIDLETGLTPRQTKIREQALAATGEDPFQEKIENWRRQKSLTMNTFQTAIDTNSQINTNPDTNPMSMILEMFERDCEIEINFPIKNHIPDPSMLKMVSKKLKGDVVEYYTEEMLRNLLSNVSEIKDTIYQQIYYKIHGMKLNSKEEQLVSKEKKLNSILPEETKVENIFLITGPIKNGKQTYKYLDEKGKIKDLLPESAKKKRYKPAQEGDLL